MKVLGIDPGVTGAWAIVELGDSGAPVLLEVGDLPVKAVQMSKRVAHRVDASGLDELFRLKLPLVDRVVVEKLTGAPGINSTTAFSLGWTAAVIDTVLSYHGKLDSHISAHPSAWKRALLVPAGKQEAKARATKLFGSDRHWPMEKDHNRAEAALLALYGALTKPARKAA